MAEIEHSGPRRGRATIRDIAGLAGVSIATVSRVLNDRPDVAPETRETVLRVVREHGFSTNRGARGLSGGRTGLIGVTLPIVEAAYFAMILSGAAEALYEQDMRMVLCPTRHQHEREVTLLGRLMHGTTDGAVLTLPEETNEELKALQRLGYPFVVVDPRVALDQGIPAVSAGHASGARAATEHLLELGHRRIAAITGPPTWFASTERLNGYRAALAAAGVLPDPELVHYSDFQEEAGEAAAGRLLDLPQPPTAIFGFNDNLAVGVMRAARARGLRVPDDLSVVGFDDLEQAAIVTPALTTVRQPLAEMGRMAISLLTRIVEGQRLEALQVELATRLIVRESTGQAPRSPL
ncbi:MAG TPA: LacI family DNA-binding transcriptional regulator [Gaiellaceae bacterium]|jgi:LacI family transcriptional regulator